MMISLSDLWAKTDPYQSIETHGLLTGIVAQELLGSFLSEGSRLQLQRGLHLNSDALMSFIGYFASLHDIGKINYYFQSKDESTKKKLHTEGLDLLDIPDFRFRHEVESCRILSRIWGEKDRRNGRKLASILGAHHQGKNHPIGLIGENTQWQSLQNRYEEMMRMQFCDDTFILPSVEKSEEGAVCALLLGIVILSDWIASGACFADAQQWADKPGTGRDHARKFLCESGLLSGHTEFGHTFCQVWPQIPQGGERELQKKVESLFLDTSERFSLILIEAPMGEGKTEAGVYAAIKMAAQWRKNGFYIALPTSATSNQMVGRMRQLLEVHDGEENVRLLHAMAWMVDHCPAQAQKYDTEEERFVKNWLMPLRRGLLSPYTVGTVDQAMMAAMFIKYGVLRLLGLAGKALVIDEIHAYDAYMQNILERLLAWCRALEIPVVLLSATLPPEKKRQLLSIYTESENVFSDDYPAITAIDSAGRQKVLPVFQVAKRQDYQIERMPILHRPSQIAEAAVRKVENGGCLCILLNTVNQAQDTYLAIRNIGFTETLLLFHSRFLAGRRDEIEKQCLKLFGKDKRFRPQKAILVATQVVEQSLDVDFDFLFSSVAPIDLLIQRMGRQYRHEDTPRPVDSKTPTLTVLTPGDGNYGVDGAVYPDCLLRQTEHLLKERSLIRVPEDLAKLVADGYDPAKAPEAELEKWMENLANEEVKSAAAEKYKLNKPEKKFRPLVEPAVFDDLEQQNYLSAQTRLSEPTVRIALVEPELLSRLSPITHGGILPIKDVRIAQDILKRSVSIRKKIYDKLSGQYNLSEFTGDNLIYGIKVIPLDNPCFENDPDIGVVWKEEKS